MPQSAEGEGGYLQGAEGEPPESAAPTPQPPSETGYPAGDATAGTELLSRSEPEAVYMHDHNCAASAGYHPSGTPLATEHVTEHGAAATAVAAEAAEAAVAAEAAANAPAESGLPDAFCPAKQDHSCLGLGRG